MAYNPLQSFIAGSDEWAMQPYADPPAPAPPLPEDLQHGTGSVWLPPTLAQQETNKDISLGGAAGTGFQQAIQQAIQQAAQVAQQGATTGAQGGAAAEAQAKAAMLANAPRHHGGHSLATQPPHIQDMFWFHYKEGAGARWLKEENDKYPPAAPAGDTSSAADKAAASKQQAAIDQAEADRAAADQKAKDAAAPAPIPAIPQSQSLDPNQGGIQTGPVAGAVKGQLFGDTKYNLALGDGGVAPGGGNPNEMYRWFIEAFSQGYDNYMDLWTKSPEEAIGAYNQWKIQAQADGIHFIGVDDQGNPGGGRLIREDRQDDFKTAIAEGEQQAATPGVGAGILGALREGTSTFSGIEQGTDPAFSIWEEMQRTGMAGTPFADEAERYLKSQIPQYIGQAGMQSARQQTPMGISDFLGQSYDRGSMSPEDLRMMISGQPGAGVNPTAFANILDQWDIEDNRFNTFNLALAGSPLANAPAAIRTPFAKQGQDYWNEYYQGTLGGEIEDVKGQADFLRFAANKMGIV